MKIRRKILVLALPLLLLFGAGVAAWYLRSASFQETVRTSLISRIENATGLRCRIKRLQLDVFHGTFLITDLSLSSYGKATGLVGVHVDEIRAAVSVSSFWHMRLRLRQLDVRKPRVELISAADRSKSGWDPEELLHALKVSLRLEASRVTVQDGRFRINDHTAPFNVAFDDLDCEIRYAKRLPSYRIRIEYKRSRIVWEERDIVHGLVMNADLSLHGLTIESFKLHRGNTLLAGNGTVTEWKSPVLSLHLEGNLDARDLKLATPSLYEGRGNIAIAADLRRDKNGVHVNGNFKAGAGGYRRMAHRGFAGIFEIRDDVLYLRKVSGKIADGEFLVNAEVQLREANKDQNEVSIRARDVPVIDAGRLLNLPLLNFENTADASTRLVWYGGKELHADIDARLHGMAAPPVQGGKSTLLEGNIRFTYVEPGSIYIESASLSSPYTNVLASGGRDSLFHVKMTTNRFSEPFDLIGGFSPPVSGLGKREPDIRNLSGRFEFDGDVRIKSSSDIEYRGSIAAQGSRWHSHQVDYFKAQAWFRSPSLELRGMEIQSGQQSVTGGMDLALDDGEHVSRFGFKGNLQNISLASVKDFGADTSRLTGTMSGGGSIELYNNRWKGNGRLHVDNGSYDGEPFDTVRAELLLDDQTIHISQSEVRRGGAWANAKGQVDLHSRILNITAQLQSFPLEQIPLVRKKELPVLGRISGSGTLGGTADEPVFSGDFGLNELRYGSWYLGNGKGRIEFKEGLVRGNARIDSDLGIMVIHADIANSAGYPGKASLDFKNFDFQKIIPAKAPPYLKDMSTALEGKVDAQGNFDDLASLRITGEVDGAHFKIHDYELHNSGPLRFNIINRNLSTESVRFVGDGTSLVLSGTVPLNDSPQLNLALNGSLNMELFEKIEKKLHTAGTAELNIRATGSKRNPQVIGRASFHNTKLDYKDVPFHFTAMQGDVVFSRNLVRLENIRGAVASGTIQLSGIIEHQNAIVRSMNMGISLRNVRMPFPRDFKSVSNADLVLSGNPDAQILSGDVDVTRMEYVRSFNLLEQLASHGTSQSGPLTTEPFLLGLRLNLEIHSENGLSIDNELTSLRGSMRMMLRGTPAYPSLTGRVEASEGTIFFRGSRFEISRAAANFVDRNRINPVLEIRAEADVKTYRLILDAVGDLDHLTLNITSDPPLSTVDILTLLTTGKAESTEGTSQRESQMAGMSAASVLSENFTGVIGKRVQRIFGLESFRVDPFLAGAENDPTARITISERISKDLVVTFSRNLTTNQEQIVIIEYDVGKNVAVVATRDENGKFGLDFRFRKRFR